MLRHLHLTDFRALREFTMTSLGRVNLLVGTNNSGKTSVLEAIQLLSAPGMPWPLWSTLARRGETRDDSDDREVEVAHIVHGHVIEAGTSFKVVGTNDSVEWSFEGTFRERNSSEPPLPLPRRVRQQLEFFDGDDVDDDALAPLELELAWRSTDKLHRLRWPLTRRGGLLREVFSGDPRRTAVEATPVHFITTEGLHRENVVVLFEQTVLTPDEDTVLDALRAIEPEIERIASVGSARRYPVGARGGIAMLVGGKKVPIGSMGDGIWRLLGIALALVRASGGTLLVDEIDTGLHYTVLVDMWRLVCETAKRLEVQVFATTHSRDCYEALAEVARSGGHDISLQRIERGRATAVAFSPREIQQAADRGIEVR